MPHSRYALLSVYGRLAQRGNRWRALQALRRPSRRCAGPPGAAPALQALRRPRVR